LWDSKPRPPPEPKDVSKKSETVIDDSHRGVGPYGPEAFSQLPAPARRFTRRLSGGLSGVSDKWLYVDPQYPEVYTG